MVDRCKDSGVVVFGGEMTREWIACGMDEAFPRQVTLTFSSDNDAHDYYVAQIAGADSHVCQDGCRRFGSLPHCDVCAVVSCTCDAYQQAVHVLGCPSYVVPTMEEVKRAEVSVLEFAHALSHKGIVPEIAELVAETIALARAKQKLPRFSRYVEILNER